MKTSKKYIVTALIVLAVVLGIARFYDSGKHLIQPAPKLQDWILATQHAGFNPRDTAWTTIFKDKMYIGNGWANGGILTRDLWSSADGVKWELVLNDTPYEPYAKLLVFKDKLWAIRTEIWSSENGQDWTKEAIAPFGDFGEVIVHNNTLLRIGHDGVWKSCNGIFWELLSDNPPFRDRAFGSIISFQGKLWLMGGREIAPNNPSEKNYPDWTTYNDVWVSQDGVAWERIIEHAPWEPRIWFKTIIHKDKIWLLGGFSNKKCTNYNDVWETEDGIHWQQINFGTIWSPRHEFGICDFNNKLWVIAGATQPVVNEVWFLED
ncbi:MAG TPA: hypothetical protein VFG29_12215 [Syntrophales bacterium]|nr:hypothetical protein [Syntrophales bacterium]